jgi:hypothetical protein
MNVYVIFDTTDLSEADKNFNFILLNFIKNNTNSKLSVVHLDVDNYFYKCYNNILNKKHNENFLKQVSHLDQYDCIITNSPNKILRKYHKFVLNTSVGIYNRSPFPQYFTLDPFGYYKDSFIYNAYKFSFKYNFNNFTLSTILKNKILTIIEEKNLKFKNKINLFPFHSESLFFKAQNLKENQFEYFKKFYKNNKNVFYTQKPLSTIFNQDVFHTELPYNLPKERFLNINSSYLIPFCKKIHVFHSTLGFQAGLWNVEIESPSLFKNWKNNQSNTIEMLLNLVWFTNKKELIERIHKLNESIYYLS